MGAGVGILIVAGTIALFVAVNLRAGRMSARSNSGTDPLWTIDPQTGQRVQQPDGGHHGGHDGGGTMGGGHHGGSHFGGGFSGGDAGGHHGH